MESGDFPETPRLSVVAGKAWLWGDDCAVWSADDWRWGARRVLPEESSDWRALGVSAERAVVLGDEDRAGWSADGEHWNFVPLPGAGSAIQHFDHYYATQGEDTDRHLVL